MSGPALMMATIWTLTAISAAVLLFLPGWAVQHQFRGRSDRAGG